MENNDTEYTRTTLGDVLVVIGKLIFSAAVVVAIVASSLTFVLGVFAFIGWLAT